MNINQIKNLLQSRNLKATSTRLSLLKEMAKNDSAMNYSAIQKALSPIDRVTLYRTLQSLKEKGIIHKAFQDGSEVYFAICGNSCEENNHHHEHVHFKCINCDTISCEKLDKIIDVSLLGFIINKIAINLEGVCNRCKVA